MILVLFIWKKSQDDLGLESTWAIYAYKCVMILCVFEKAGVFWEVYLKIFCLILKLLTKFLSGLGMWDADMSEISLHYQRFLCKQT